MPSSLWWFLAGLLLVLELVSTTLVLLFFALGFAAAALVSWLGGSLAAQLMAASLGMLAGMTWWVWRRGERPVAAAQNLDVGRLLDIPEWDARAEAKVYYRGAVWQARWIGEGTPQAALVAVQPLLASAQSAYQFRRYVPNLEVTRDAGAPINIGGGTAAPVPQPRLQVSAVDVAFGARLLGAAQSASVAVLAGVGNICLTTLPTKKSPTDVKREPDGLATARRAGQ